MKSFIRPVPLIALLSVLLGACATSPPAINTSQAWVEDPAGRPVIDRGSEGTWDHYAVDNPFLHVEGDTLYCFFEAQDRPFDKGGREQVGLAQSQDGVHWTKLPDNPVLGVGPDGSWDDVVAKLPVVTRRGKTYYMYYSGRDGEHKGIGVATSTDLVHWAKHESNPVLKGRPGRWDIFLSTYPAPPFKIDGHFYVLFRGMRTMYSKQAPALAVSDDLIHWRRTGEDPLIATDEEVASFAVARTAGAFTGIAQAPDRCYWTSEDLRTWRKGPKAVFRGPKVSTVSNPVFFRGEWIVVYEQDDRIYRAVLR
jgi:predicted GH43/DUF377 family glycosyl hydrolase